MLLLVTMASTLPPTSNRLSINDTKTENTTDLENDAHLYKTIGISTVAAILIAMMLYLIICFTCCNGAEKVG